MRARILLVVLAIVALTATSASAKIWLVDNRVGNTADFTTVSSAVTAATAGDTIYVVGSGNLYSGGITITKQLTILGPGYFLGENPDTQALPTQAYVGAITFNAGSEGSLIAGLSSNVSMNVNASNITIMRNYISVSNNSTIFINGPSVSNVIIKQNYFLQTHATSTFHTINLVTSPQNIVINNNYIERSLIGGTSYAINMTSGASAEIFNNVIRGDLTLYNSTFYNNILYEGTLTESGNSFSNNIGDLTQFGTLNGNQSNVVMTTVFVGSGSTDGMWQLVAGSPAIGAGTSGADIGMFGGYTPYVLSGLPNIPHIYFFEASTTGSATSGLPVRIKAKTGGQ